MRVENVLLSVIGVAALLMAARLAWSGRALSTLPAEETPPTGGGEAAARAFRTAASAVAAGLIAGLLVTGLGGRLMMRLLAATSSEDVQGRLTEADEVVGEITLGGTIGFVIFAGLLVGAASGLLYVFARRFLPGRAWVAGLVFGLILLATLGVADPLSPDNTDFSILTPVPLAVGFIVALALLFGAVVAVLTARFESATRLVRRHDTSTASGSRLAYWALVLLAPAPPLPVFVAVYVGGCAIAKGRVAAMLDTSAVRSVALGAGVIAAAVALWRVGVVASDII